VRKAVVALGIAIIVAGSLLAFNQYQVEKTGVSPLATTFRGTMVTAQARERAETQGRLHVLISFGVPSRPYRGKALAVKAERVRSLAVGLRTYGLSLEWERTLPRWNMAVAKIPAENLDVIAGQPSVRAIAVNSFISVPEFQSAEDPYPTPEEVARTHHLGALPSAEGVDVAILDSGASPIVEYEFAKSVTGSRACDDYGHGSVTGQILDTVAPKADLQSWRALGSDGTARISTILKALSKAVGVTGEDSPEIINMSVGSRRGIFSPLEEACETALREYHVAAIVAASGNTGGPITAPASSPEVVSVGALNTEMERAGYSSRKADIWVVANQRILWGGTKLEDSKGTSWASPVAAGALARYISTVKDRNSFDAVATIKSGIFQAEATGLRVLDGRELADTKPVEEETPLESALVFVAVGVAGAVIAAVGIKY